MCGTNPISLINELRGLGTAHVVAQFDEIPQLNNLVPENCYIYWDVILTSTRGENAVRDVFIFVEDDCGIRIELIDSSGPIDRGQGCRGMPDSMILGSAIARYSWKKTSNELA